jgi:hypothetical protein
MDLNKYVTHIVISVLCLMFFWFIGYQTGERVTENRFEKMAKDTKYIFIKEQPYKVWPVKEIPIEIERR